MAATNQNFTLYQGDSLTAQFSVVDDEGSPVDLTGATITWRAATVSHQTVLDKAVGRGITVTDAAGGVCEVALAPDDTASLLGTYRHQLRVVDATGQEAVVAEGAMTVQRRIGAAE